MQSICCSCEVTSEHGSYQFQFERDLGADLTEQSNDFSNKVLLSVMPHLLFRASSSYIELFVNSFEKQYIHQAGSSQAPQLSMGKILYGSTLILPIRHRSFTNIKREQ